MLQQAINILLHWQTRKNLIFRQQEHNIRCPSDNKSTTSDAPEDSANATKGGKEKRKRKGSGNLSRGKRPTTDQQPSTSRRK
eukprot:8625257-Ditylum_brightwellii.AAC.1